MDARFEDGAEQALTLGAETAEDLEVLSALVQDAVLTGSDILWQHRARRLVLLLNRFRWEDAPAARAAGRPFERVRALLVISGALGVSAQGITRTDADMVLSLLGLGWEPEGEGPGGRLVLTFAGDGAIAVRAECLEVVLRDVTLPYLAPSGKAPAHD